MLQDTGYTVQESGTSINNMRNIIYEKIQRIQDMRIQDIRILLLITMDKR